MNLKIVHFWGLSANYKLFGLVLGLNHMERGQERNSQSKRDIHPSSASIDRFRLTFPFVPSVIFPSQPKAIQPEPNKSHRRRFIVQRQRMSRFWSMLDRWSFFCVQNVTSGEHFTLLCSPGSINKIALHSSLQDTKKEGTKKKNTEKLRKSEEI